MTTFFANSRPSFQSARQRPVLNSTALISLLLLSTACSRSSVVGGQQADTAAGQANDVSVGELSKDGGMNDIGHDTSIGVDTRTPDVGEFDGVGDVQAEMDGTKGQPGTLPKVCVAQLPKPGQPCSKAGVIRCTNIGAHEIWQRKGFCMRPNHVRCELDVTGVLRWKLNDCAGRAKDAIYNSDSCGFFWSCVVDSEGDRCQPTGLVPVTAIDDNVIPEKQWDAVSKSHFSPGVGICYSTHPNPAARPGTSYVSCLNSLVTCTTLANTGSLAAGIKASFGKCGQYLERGSWRLPVEICRITNFECPNKPQLNCVDPNDEGKFVPACATSFKAGCFVDPATNKPRCRKDCKDAGAPYY